MIEIGSFIGDRYEIIEKIGAGGMSDVFKAKDQVLGRFVAIKVLKPEFAEDVNFVSKFHAEAQSAAVLQHPNIVNIYDVSSEEHVHFIVMEYVEGITLKTYIEKKGRLQYKEAISIAIQVGRGIEAAHNNKIVHRDIKPQNIMISSEGKVKVTDFGIARAATSNTIHSDVMGSVHYSSPEQARNGFIDGKSDIYSLGIVMYEMVTGRVPFDGDTTVSIAIQHLQDEMVLPSTYAEDLPISLEKIILKCTQKSQDRRYPTMGDLLNDLKHAMMEPDVDFVVIESNVNAGKTTVIGQEDLENIRHIASAKTMTDSVTENNGEAGVEESENKSHVIASKPRNKDDDDESDGFLNPKMEKLVTILGIITAVIIIIIVIYLIGSIAGIFGEGSFFGKGNKTPDVPDKVINDIEPIEEDDTQNSTDVIEQVLVPDVKNKSFDEAKAILKEFGLGIYQDGTESSNDVEEGKIISQNISDGERVEPGTTIYVIVSSGVGEFEVPKVDGYTDTAAITMLDDAGLAYKREYENSDEVPEGTVIRQVPEAGTMAAKGDTVTIIVSQGKEALSLISVKGLTEEEAKAALEEAGLVLGTVDYEYSSTVEEGLVISQSEPEFKTVYAGTEIGIVVSLGEEEVLNYCKVNVALPNDDTVVSANITLYDDQDEILSTWKDVSASMFPYAIEVDDIECTEGTLVIEWNCADEDGNPIISTQTSPLTFKPQN